MMESIQTDGNKDENLNKNVIFTCYLFLLAC